jgi:hypothetical protein
MPRCSKGVHLVMFRLIHPACLALKEAFRSSYRTRRVHALGKYEVDSRARKGVWDTRLPPKGRRRPPTRANVQVVPTVSKTRDQAVVTVHSMIQAKFLRSNKHELP